MSTLLLRINGGCYKLVMETMVVISLRMPTALRVALERVAERMNETEGEFIRRAIADRLRGEGAEIPDDLLKRKSRKGIGGYPTHRSKRPPPLGLNRSPAGGFAPVDFYGAAAPGLDTAKPEVKRSSGPKDRKREKAAVTPTEDAASSPDMISSLADKEEEDALDAIRRRRRAGRSK